MTDTYNHMWPLDPSSIESKARPKNKGMNDINVSSTVRTAYVKAIHNLLLLNMFINMMNRPIVASERSTKDLDGQPKDGIHNPFFL